MQGYRTGNRSRRPAVRIDVLSDGPKAGTSLVDHLNDMQRVFSERGRRSRFRTTTVSPSAVDRGGDAIHMVDF
jgi:hypothetical protein